MNKDISQTRWWGGEVQISKKFFESHLVTVGLEGRHDFLVDQENRYVDPRVRLTTAVFYNQIKDQITQIDQSTDPSVNEWIFLNLGAAEVRGAEVGLEGQWAAGLRGGMSYTYANATDQATRAWLSNSPRHVAKINVAVPLYRDKVFAGVELQALSRRHSATTPDTTPGFVLANVTLFSRQLTKGLDLSVSVYNLLNTHYSDPVSPDFTQQFIEQDVRNFRVKLTLQRHFGQIGD